MCSNVLPSAPHDESSLYLQLSPHDFRMQKVNEIAAALNAEVAHYHVVAKKNVCQENCQQERDRFWCSFSQFINREFRLCTLCCGPSCLNSAQVALAGHSPLFLQGL